MFDRVKTNIQYLIRDMRFEYSSVNNTLSLLDSNQSINDLRSYVDNIINQIGLLDEHYDDPISFCKDIRFIKLYSKMIIKNIQNIDNDILSTSYIYLLNGIVYCDEIANTYINHISSSDLSKINDVSEDINNNTKVM